MARIVAAEPVAPEVVRFRVEAPRIATHRHPGQFVIVRVTPDGERIPLTIADADPAEGTITLVVQGVGYTTRSLNRLGPGDEIADVVGPLGEPTEIARFGTVVVVGGGVGTAIAYPTARALIEAGNEVVAVVGARTADLLVYVDELEACGAEVRVCTDDGSRGRHGTVTDELAELVEHGRPDRVFAAGPVPMMRAVAETTRPAGIPTVVSLNPIMVDGTGMCGGCRVVVGGRTRFACVDGPDFDAHAVDFDVLARRNAAYRDHERAEIARLAGGGACGPDTGTGREAAR
ncbi:MAG: sulfide/dihydroorotate dehydrogenase-like FAD/NAD-binding protein [Actinomyces sp.]|nr:MAG: sulfide/dihydroorotate dehydrogenase-like FAD/NAD-binding protein [Actinomyces sp.]